MGVKCFHVGTISQGRSLKVSAQRRPHMLLLTCAVKANGIHMASGSPGEKGRCFMHAILQTWKVENI